jgi:hypothetical protein
MAGFSERGLWNYEARRYFFEDVMSLWQENHQDESLVNYVLKDQELQGTAMNEFQQAGLGESQPAGIGEAQQNDGIHRELSRKIFESVAAAIRDGADSVQPEPYRFRFHDAYTDFLARNRI